MSEKDTADFAARQKELDDRQTDLDKRDANQRHKDNVSFAESLVDGEKLLPTSRDKVVALLDAAATTNTTVSFAEGEDAVDLAKGLRDVLETQPKIVNFGAVDMGGEPADFSQDPKALADAAISFQSDQAAKGITVATDEAVEAVLKGANS